MLWQRRSLDFGQRNGCVRRAVLPDPFATQNRMTLSVLHKGFQGYFLPIVETRHGVRVKQEPT